MILFSLRTFKVFHIENCSKWTMTIAFSVKLLAGLFFYYIYVYKIGVNSEPSDALRFFNESKQLQTVFWKSKSDFFALFTGFGDNARMLHEHMDNTFIWDAGNFTLINDSRNTIRFHSLLHFFSNNNILIHFLALNVISLIGLQQLYLAFKSYSSVKPIYIFYAILLLPSLIFWSSSILKEPFLILGIGLFSRGILGNEIQNKKRYILILVGIIFLILFKPYIFVCLIPALISYLLLKHIFKFKIIKTFLFTGITTIIILVSFNNQRKKFTEYISRKQFDLENVGEGGVHAYIGRYVDNGYYYFKPNQYQNFSYVYDSILMTKPSDVYFLSVNTTQVPYRITIQPTGEKWKIHNIMPGTESYFRSTLINNSFTQLIRNIPEALINALFRPFINDKGSTLKFPLIIEAWSVFILLIISIIFKRKNIQKKELGIISSLAIFSLLLLLLIGWTTPISGAIVRFRFPAQLAILIISMILIDYKRLIKTKNG